MGTPRISSTLRSVTNFEMNVNINTFVRTVEHRVLLYSSGGSSLDFEMLLGCLRIVIIYSMDREVAPNIIDDNLISFLQLLFSTETVENKFLTDKFNNVEDQNISIINYLANIPLQKNLAENPQIEEFLEMPRRLYWKLDMCVQTPSLGCQDLSDLQDISTGRLFKRRLSTLPLDVDKRYNKNYVSNTLQVKAESNERNKQLKKSQFSFNDQSTKPTIAASVVVQTKLEKDVFKQGRKEERKMNKLLKSNITEMSTTTIHAMQLRVHKQKELVDNIRQQPLFNSQKLLKKRLMAIPRYPFVFDSQMECTQHASYIGSNKISLPESAQRVDTKQYEEVKIPAHVSPISILDSKRIKIEDLDDIGKLVFSNIKELNLIQSVVYPMAYHTNNNLLICAPTGAGKTNVAMLTIVSILRTHIENGEINLSSFKIVYIAPMKALVSEIVDNFQLRLKTLNIKVRELTGDMQLSKAEMQNTQVLVTTPEKWDVVTRKGVGDISMINLVKLMIIDEVHLLHGSRGPVLEALVARTLRLVESSQKMIRIVGLSATLPNYTDIGHFLRVDPMKGLFYFDSRFRPVPLDINFIGVKSIKSIQQQTDMDEICYNKCLEMVQKNYQVMVFVHARNATVRTATVLHSLAQKNNHCALFLPNDSAGYNTAFGNMLKSKNKHLIELFQSGLSIHHAGMLRRDRRLVEKYFSEGHIKVLVCTATLAWGVNLPTHAAIIKGTDVYDAKHGSFIDLGILDVLQIFGRAGRPQFDTRGVGTIITTHDKLSRYLSLLTNQFPIESSFIECLADNLNAEITSGTVSNVNEAIEWLSYTYLFVRMRINPIYYGIDYDDIQSDPLLRNKRRALIIAAAISLDKAKMIRFNYRTEDFGVTDLGRTASHYYIKYDTVQKFNELLKPFMTEAEIFDMISQAQEFQQLKIREEEFNELDELQKYNCKVPCRSFIDNVSGKVNILMQTYLSRGFVKSFSLTSDMLYIVQNILRIARAIFTIVLRQNNALLAGKMIQICHMFEKQIWSSETPLRQFSCLNYETIDKIETRGTNVYTLRDMQLSEVKSIIHSHKQADLLLQCSNEFPLLEADFNVQPITRTVLRIEVKLCANFIWNDKTHGKVSEHFWVWIEDPETNFIYHSETIKISRNSVLNRSLHIIFITIPLREPFPSQYFVRIVSDLWLGSKMLYPLNLHNLTLPDHNTYLTELLPLQPLAVNTLKSYKYESLYSFSYFNPIQTQVFHSLYYTNYNILVGAPTGSGKTIISEIAMCRAFRINPKAKVVYVAPLKALVKERVRDWKARFENNLKINVVELTGDTLPDLQSIQSSNIIVTTPEKWDSISRSWQTREYVKDIILMIIDEIHMLGEDRGPVVEIIVSRTNFITSFTRKNIRIVALSTTLANPCDIATWLGIKKRGLYNFKPSVRPVPLSVHITGFPGKQYCPRMAAMNRPIYQAIRTYSPKSSTIIFVSSRRQTRLTALDIITCVAGDSNPKQFLHSTPEVEDVLYNIKDSNLKFCLAFGIGLHHAGLLEVDKKAVEYLFLHRKIQILVATATLAWGVNLPAHLVIVKGTEYFDGKLKKYVDMPITDVLQMIGRAGRPQFDTEGIAVVLVHDIKKNFYKKFLYDPFPVESSLLNVLHDHINAEIVSGSIQSKQSVLDYLTWTYFLKRLLQNPSYYNLETTDVDNVTVFLSSVIEVVTNELKLAGCIIETNDLLTSTFLGRISSYYYVSYHTIKLFLNELTCNMETKDILWQLSNSYEFYQLPVRHNEDVVNEELAKYCRYQPTNSNYGSPYTKTFLLLQAHIMRLNLPNSDYMSDTKSVLDQATRVLQAMMDYTAERGWLTITIRLQLLSQSIIQGRWFDAPPSLTLFQGGNIDLENIHKVPKAEQLTLPVLKDMWFSQPNQFSYLRENFKLLEVESICEALENLPDLKIELVITQFKDNNQCVFPLNNVGKSIWIDVNSNESYDVLINLCRKGKLNNNLNFSPNYPKTKREGWYLTLGSQTNNELLAMKRVIIRNNFSKHRLYFRAPTTRGKCVLSLYLMSDCYIGIDQQIDFPINVI